MLPDLDEPGKALGRKTFALRELGRVHRADGGPADDVGANPLLVEKPDGAGFEITLGRATAQHESYRHGSLPPDWLVQLRANSPSIRGRYLVASV